jgi:hypothetical protein
MTIATRYGKNRAWAVALAGPDEDDQLTALVALWIACREYATAGDGRFRAFAEPRINAALRKDVGRVRTTDDDAGTGRSEARSDARSAA